MLEIPEGWEEFHREMGGWAHKEKWGTMNIRFPHPHLDFSELIMEWLPTFLPPNSKVGLILIRPQGDTEGKEE